MTMQNELPPRRLLIDASKPGPEPRGTTQWDPCSELIGPLLNGTSNVNEVANTTLNTAATPAIFDADIAPSLRIRHLSQASLPSDPWRTLA